MQIKRNQEHTIDQIRLRIQISPRLPPHLEVLAGEADGHLALETRALDEHLEVVGEAIGRGGAIGLDDADVVAVEVAGEVPDGELVEGEDLEAAGAVDGVEVSGYLLLCRRRRSGVAGDVAGEDGEERQVGRGGSDIDHFLFFGWGLGKKIEHS